MGPQLLLASVFLPVSGDWDVGGGKGLYLCLWDILPLCWPEAIGQLCLFSWVSDVQTYGAAWQLPAHAKAEGRTGPLQDPSGTNVFLVSDDCLENEAERKRN